MKLMTLSIFLLFAHVGFTQVKPGIYEAIGDSIVKKTGRINDNSKLSINSDHTFSYQHRVMAEAAVSFDKAGTWSVKSNRLYLEIPDSACKAVFKIQGNVLKYLFNMCDPEKPGWETKQIISGNFLYKQD